MTQPTGAPGAPRQGADALTRAEARARGALIADPAYKIALDLDSGDQTFGCEATVRFRATAPGGTSFIDFTASSTSP